MAKFSAKEAKRGLSKLSIAGKNGGRKFLQKVAGRRSSSRRTK
jgi:hypothetical protein